MDTAYPYPELMRAFRFKVRVAGKENVAQFASFSGVSMEVDYKVYNEGGSLYPRYFFKGVKPQVLVLEQGVVTSVDSVSLLMAMVNQGMSIPLAGTITLKDSFGSVQRIWSVVGAHLRKVSGPLLNSEQPELAVTRIELMHNGVFNNGVYRGHKTGYGGAFPAEHGSLSLWRSGPGFFGGAACPGRV